MPSFKVLGYNYFFWSNEYQADGCLEPVHVHFCKGKPYHGAPKIWINRDGRVAFAEDYSIDDASDVLEVASENAKELIAMWRKYFKNEMITFNEEVFE